MAEPLSDYYEMRPWDYYLSSGRFTEITKPILDLAESFNAEGEELIQQILDYLEKNIPYTDRIQYEDKERFLSLHHKRTAEQIVADGFSISCTDTGNVFAAICRAKGIPTNFLITLDQQSFMLNPRSYNGHVFCELKMGDQVFLVDPMRNRYTDSADKDGIERVLRPEGFSYMVVAQVRDYSDLGISSHAEMRKWVRGVWKRKLNQLMETLNALDD